MSDYRWPCYVFGFDDSEFDSTVAVVEKLALVCYGVSDSDS